MSDVHVYLYDLSLGLAEQGGTPLRKPVKEFLMGHTEIKEKAFLKHLLVLSKTSDEICQHLFNRGIPEYILNLPNEVSNTPMGFLLKPFIENMANKINVNQNPDTGSHSFAQPIENLWVNFNQLKTRFEHRVFDDYKMIQVSLNAIESKSPKNKLLLEIYDAVIGGMTRGDEAGIICGLTVDHFNLLNFNDACQYYEEAIYLCYAFLSVFHCFPDMISMYLVLMTEEREPVSIKTLARESVNLKVLTCGGNEDEKPRKLESLKSQLICNILCTFGSNEDQFNPMQYRRIFNFSEILDFIERLVLVDRSSDRLEPSCFFSAISLAYNCSLCSQFDQDLSLGGYLLNFIEKLDENYPGYKENEIELTLKTIYILVVRYDSVYELAKIMAISEKIKTLKSTSQTISNIKDDLVNFLED